MRISLVDRLGIGNAGAIANAGQDAVRRQLEDEAIGRLVSALSRHDGAHPAVQHATAGRELQQSRRAG